jgi:hypothetical protein
MISAMQQPMAPAPAQLPTLDKIRFAVGTEDGPRSAWWFVQIEDKGDVYMSVSSIAGYMKLSLHRDRLCQWGFHFKTNQDEH